MSTAVRASTWGLPVQYAHLLDMSSGSHVRFINPEGSYAPIAGKPSISPPLYARHPDAPPPVLNLTSLTDLLARSESLSLPP